MICTNCQSQYGQTVNVRDGGKAEWQCRDCKAVQPWVETVPGLVDALADAVVVLASLHLSVTWELCPEVKEQIAAALVKCRRVLGVGK